MLCRRSGIQSSPGAARVHLNVYDLASINGYAYWFGLGIYHSGVQVYGVEYAFGAHDYSTTGIFEGEPKHFGGFTFRKSIPIGWTDKCIAEVRMVMEELSEKYKGDSYNLMSNNCNHFCNDVCIKLTGNPIPKWVNRLARIGLLCKCIVPADLKSKKIQQQKLEDNACDVHKKKLKKSTNKLSSSPSNTSCSPTIMATTGSRNKRSLPPSQPLIIASGAN